MPNRFAAHTPLRLAFYALLALALVWPVLTTAGSLNEFRDAQVMFLHERAALETVKRFGPREAAVFPEFGRRYSWYELAREVDDIARSIHPHPTLSETVAFAAETFHGTATEIYKPRRDRHGS